MKRFPFYCCKSLFACWSTHCSTSFYITYQHAFHIKILLGNEYTQSCASPDIAEAIFQTGGTSQVCEWLNDGIDGDSVCYCKTNECNTIEILASWIQNGGVCKFLLIFLIVHPSNINHNIKSHLFYIEVMIIFLHNLYQDNGFFFA